MGRRRHTSGHPAVAGVVSVGVAAVVSEWRAAAICCCCCCRRRRRRSCVQGSAQSLFNYRERGLREQLQLE
jgi:hypothetical protein